MLSRRLEFDFLRLVPDLDHVRECVQALGDQEVFRGFKHQLFNQVDHLIDERDSHGQVAKDHHLLQALHCLLCCAIIEAKQ